MKEEFVQKALLVFERFPPPTPKSAEVLEKDWDSWNEEEKAVNFARVSFAYLAIKQTAN